MSNRNDGKKIIGITIETHTKLKALSALTRIPMRSLADRVINAGMKEVQKEEYHQISDILKKLQSIL